MADGGNWIMVVNGIPMTVIKKTGKEAAKAATLDSGSVPDHHSAYEFYVSFRGETVLFLRSDFRHSSSAD